MCIKPWTGLPSYFCMESGYFKKIKSLLQTCLVLTDLFGMVNSVALSGMQANSYE